MDYINELGSLALASRLKRLLNRMHADGEKVYVVADDAGSNHGPNGVYLKYFDGEIWHDWIWVILLE